MGSDVVTACVLIIGNEILSGRTQDANLRYIATTLGAQGVRVMEARVIPDVHEVIIDSLNDSRANCDYVLTTGGIGPTHDDITAECVAQAFGVPLVMSPEIESRIRSRPAPEDVMANRLLMARIPQGATLIENSTGGPQGFAIENVYVMAGIPAVLQAMLPNVEFTGGAVVRSCSVTVYLGESNISEDLKEIQDRVPEVDIGSYPFVKQNRYGTTLVVRGTDGEVLESTLESLKNMIVAHGETPHDITFE